MLKTGNLYQLKYDVTLHIWDGPHEDHFLLCKNDIVMFLQLWSGNINGIVSKVLHLDKVGYIDTFALEEIVKC